MGYQITFLPSEEKMNEYKPWDVNKPHVSQIANTKRNILSYCMKSHNNTYQIASEIEFNIKLLANQIKEEEKRNAYFRWKENEKGELWYCGWQFATDATIDEDDAIKNTVDQLFMFADIIETPNYFEETDHFFKKYQDIEESIDDFVEVIENIAIHDIINDLKEYEEKDVAENVTSNEDFEE